jgi:hypothetical protein
MISQALTACWNWYKQKKCKKEADPTVSTVFSNSHDQKKSLDISYTRVNNYLELVDKRKCIILCCVTISTWFWHKVGRIAQPHSHLSEPHFTKNSNTCPLGLRHASLLFMDDRQCLLLHLPEPTLMFLHILSLIPMLLSQSYLLYSLLFTTFPEMLVHLCAELYICLVLVLYSFWQVMNGFDHECLSP